MILFKYLLNNYKNLIYINSNRVKYNLWFFTHITILYIYQRTSIMVWISNIEGLASKFIKTLKFDFSFINLYKNVITYVVISIFVLFLL